MHPWTGICRSVLGAFLFINCTIVFYRPGRLRPAHIRGSTALPPCARGAGRKHANKLEMGS